ncbi:MAG: DUF1475 domain-containing protein [Chitinophagaceae bacterium]|nr:MAG: DUF1475 domain-containing protein [Chitinophagaceae bacterium]
MWVVLFVCLGSIALCTYVLTEFFNLKAGKRC